MSRQKTYLRSFAGGEISPEMFGRIDDARFQAGAARLRNFVCKPQGPVIRRPGTRFVREVKDSTKRTRLIPFEFSLDQSLAIELGAGYFRFHTNGGTLLASAADFVNTKLLSGVNGTPGVMQFNFSVAHQLATGDAINLTYGIGGAVGPLLLYTTYYAIYVDSTHIQVAASREDALAGTFLDLAGTWTSVYVSRVYTAGEAVGYPTAGSAGYVCQVESRTGTTPLAQVPVTCGAPIGTPGVVTATNHGYFHGTKIVFALNGGTLPAELTAGVIYYAIPLTANTFNVATTYGGAAIAFTTASTGSPTTARADLWASAVEYEIANSYAEADLFDINFVQSNDVVTLVHPSYPPAELRRLSATHWTFTNVAFGQPLPTPVIASVTPTVGAQKQCTAITMADPAVITTIGPHGLSPGDAVYLAIGGGGQLGSLTTSSFFVVGTTPSTTTLTLQDVLTGDPFAEGFSTTVAVAFLRATSLGSNNSESYVVTAVNANGSETTASAPMSATNNLLVSGASNVITWGGVSGASRYRVYRLQNGIYGIIGEVDAPTVTFTDDGSLNADLGRSPPSTDASLAGMDYPSAVSYFEQRKVYAGTRAQPQDVWMSASSTEADFTYHIPVLDSDRIYFRIAARDSSIIRHVVPLDQLLLLTSTAEYRVTPVNDDAITPSSVSVRPQSYVGCSKVRPAVINNSLVFIAARGGHVRELGYQADANGWVTGDLSLRAAHLFDELEVTDMAYAKAPLPVLWFVSSSGNLLGFTYVPEEGIGAWHVHTTAGLFESCAAVAEGQQDSVYVVVQRTINGSQVRYIEQLTLNTPTLLEDSFYVDCGLTYDSSATTTITGLSHLEGATVTALADGIVRTGLTVASGQIVLPVAASKVHVGLPLTAELLTLPPIMQLSGYGTGHEKNINKVWLRVFESARFYVGPSATALVAAEGMTATLLETRKVQVTVPGSWTADGQILVRATDPLPLTIVGMTLEVSAGG